MGQSSIIMVVTLAIVFTIVTINSEKRIAEVTNSAISYFSENTSQNICNSATEMLLTKIADDVDYRSNRQVSQNMLNGDVTYTVTDTVINSEDRIKIRVVANYYGEKTENIIIASIPENGFIPASVKAATTTNNNIRTLGSLKIDGRDHDKTGNLIVGGNGTLGVWTTGTLRQSGNSKIGGADSTSDYSPTKPANSNIIQTSQVWSGGYPDSPDKVMGGVDLGFAEGYLKSVALSGSNGSQYVTNPSHLTYPLSGITYVEISSTWNSANITGSGILIVHNSSANATIKTCRGNFSGLVIADDIDKVHGTIIGGLIGLTSSPASGNCIGNGNGDILFSREAIKLASTKSGILFADNEFFTPKHRIAIEHWLEL